MGSSLGWQPHAFVCPLDGQRIAGQHVLVPSGVLPKVFCDFSFSISALLSCFVASMAVSVSGTAFLSRKPSAIAGSWDVLIVCRRPKSGVGGKLHKRREQTDIKLMIWFDR